MSYPATLWDLVKKLTDTVLDARENDAVTKSDLIDSVENEVAQIISKMVAVPTTTSFCMFNQNQANIVI